MSSSTGDMHKTKEIPTLSLSLTNLINVIDVTNFVKQKRRIFGEISDTAKLGMFTLTFLISVLTFTCIASCEDKIVQNNRPN